jgi:hypothetical protein
MMDRLPMATRAIPRGESGVSNRVSAAPQSPDAGGDRPPLPG